MYDTPRTSHKPVPGSGSVAESSSGARAGARRKFSDIERFFSAIICSPLPPDDDGSTSFDSRVANNGRPQRPLTAEERKRQNDLDLIDQRMREASMRRKMERKEQNEEDFLGEETLEARRRVMQEETYRQDKAVEFEQQQRAMLQAQREADAQRNSNKTILDQMGSMDLTFGLSGVVTKAFAQTNGFEADGNTVSTLPQADRDRFDQLLGLEGLPVLVHLPTRDGGSKSRRAVLRCERNATYIVAEIEGKRGKTKSIRFDVRIVKAIRVGAGSSVPVPTDYTHGDTRRFYFVLQDKPDLTCELDSQAARDVAIAGFVYVVSTRRSPLFTQQARLNQAVSIGKGGQEAMLPSQSRAQNIVSLSGWTVWGDVAEKGMFGIRTKYKPRLLLTNTRFELEVFAPPRGVRGDYPDDMVGEGPLRPFVDGRWDVSFLEGMGFERVDLVPLPHVQAVSATMGKGDEALVTLTFESAPELNLRVANEGVQRKVVEFLSKQIKTSKTLLSGRR